MGSPPPAMHSWKLRKPTSSLLPQGPSLLARATSPLPWGCAPPLLWHRHHVRGTRRRRRCSAELAHYVHADYSGRCSSWPVFSCCSVGLHELQMRELVTLAPTRAAAAMDVHLSCTSTAHGSRPLLVRPSGGGFGLSVCPGQASIEWAQSGSVGAPNPAQCHRCGTVLFISAGCLTAPIGRCL